MTRKMGLYCASSGEYAPRLAAVATSSGSFDKSVHAFSYSIIWQQPARGKASRSEIVMILRLQQTASLFENGPCTWFAYIRQPYFYTTVISFCSNGTVTFDHTCRLTVRGEHPTPTFATNSCRCLGLKHIKNRWLESQKLETQEIG